LTERVLQYLGWNVGPPRIKRRERGPQPTADPGQVQTILASGLFDVTFYTYQVGQVLTAADAVAHYLSTGHARGLNPNRLFSPIRYLAAHPDVAAAGMEAFLHYVLYGIEEGRQVELPDDTFTDLRRVPLEALSRRRVLRQAISAGFDPSRPSRVETVAVYASSLGNFFFRQIADRLAAGFRASGNRVYRLDQNCQRPSGVTLDFVVAPHEFFLLGAGPRWLQALDLARGIVFNTEQPGTPWYFRSLRYAQGAGTLVDLSPHSAVMLPALGFPSSAFLPLGFVAGSVCKEPEGLPEWVHGLEDLAARPGDHGALAWRERPIDVLFLGTLTERRSAVLARLAPTLAAHRCFIHAPGHGRPLRGAKGQIDDTHSRWLASQSKILLNVHRGEFPYFEWHRVVTLGAEQGTVVISEPSLPVPDIHPGMHYLSAQIEEMPSLIERLLGPDGAATASDMTARCQADLAERLDLGVELRALTHLHGQRIAGA
jgi:hypothetical protein